MSASLNEYEICNLANEKLTLQLSSNGILHFLIVARFSLTKRIPGLLRISWGPARFAHFGCMLLADFIRVVVKQTMSLYEIAFAYLVDKGVIAQDLAMACVDDFSLDKSNISYLS